MSPEHSGIRRHLLNPLLNENPISVQILGLCSALAVSRSLEPALIMAASVTGVLLFSNLSISALRHLLPRSIRLVLEVTIIASGVIVVDELLKAFAPDISAVLSVFVGLIITNCILLGRAESFALQQPMLASAADAIGNGLGYSIILLVIAGCRELLGSGRLLNYEILPTVDRGGWYLPNEMMLYAPSAFFLLGAMVWLLKAWMRRRHRTQATASDRGVR